MLRSHPPHVMSPKPPGQARSCWARLCTPNLHPRKSWDQRPFSILSASTLLLVPSRGWKIPIMTSGPHHFMVQACTATPTAPRLGTPKPTVSINNRLQNQPSLACSCSSFFSDAAPNVGWKDTSHPLWSCHTHLGSSQRKAHILKPKPAQQPLSLGR